MEITEAPIAPDTVDALVLKLKHKRSITFYDLIRAIERIGVDDRIKAFHVDFSTSGREGQQVHITLAQVQELHSAIRALRAMKDARLGSGAFELVAYTDTFESQLHVHILLCIPLPAI